MSLSELPNELSERGIWWQVGGFAIAGCVSVAILQIWDGSGCWAYRSFEIAVKDLYWMFVLPLAGLIEGVRKLFEKASEIRAAQREKIWRRALEKGRAEGRQELRAEVRQEVRAEVRQEVRAEVRQEVQQQVRQQVQSQFRALFRDAPEDPETGAITISRETRADLLGEPADGES